MTLKNPTFLQACLHAAGALALAFSATGAHADALATLRDFAANAKTGKGGFMQTVTSPDGKKVRKSTGSLEFQRPDRFRFTYNPPMEQLIVGDGKQVWLYDADLAQVTVRPMDQALGATPAALLSSGGALERDFALRNLPAGAAPAGPGIEWVEAVPKAKDGQFQSVRIGFKGRQLAALEILDGFGQRSRLDFTGFETQLALPPSRFQFAPPAGVDVLKQP